jgi:hypothetical protein
MPFAPRQDDDGVCREDSHEDADPHVEALAKKGGSLWNLHYRP